MQPHPDGALCFRTAPGEQLWVPFSWTGDAGGAAHEVGAAVAAPASGRVVAGVAGRVVCGWTGGREGRRVCVTVTARVLGRTAG